LTEKITPEEPFGRKLLSWVFGQNSGSPVGPAWRMALECGMNSSRPWNDGNLWVDFTAWNENDGNQDWTSIPTCPMIFPRDSQYRLDGTSTSLRRKRIKNHPSLNLGK